MFHVKHCVFKAETLVLFDFFCGLSLVNFTHAFAARNHGPDQVVSV